MTQEQLNKEAESLGIKLLHIDSLTYCMYKDHSYIGYFEWKTGRKFVRYNNRKYASMSDLLPDLEEYNNSLEYPIESYNPCINDDWKKQVRLNHIFSQIGYSEIKNILAGATRRSHKDIFGASLSHFNNGSFILRDYSWINVYEDDDDIDTIKSKLYNFITPLYTNIIATLASDLAKIKRTKALDSIKITHFVPNTLQLVELNGTEGIIQLLEDTLKELKETLK